MSEAMAREKAAFYAEQARLGNLVFDPSPGQAPNVLAPAPTAALTVRQLGDQWTNGALFERFGPVNRLRIKASAQIDAWCLAKHVYPVRTRGRSGPAFGELRVGRRPPRSTASSSWLRNRKSSARRRGFIPTSACVACLI